MRVEKCKLIPTETVGNIKDFGLKWEFLRYGVR